MSLENARDNIRPYNPPLDFSALTTLYDNNEPRDSIQTGKFKSSMFGLQTPFISFGLNDPEQNY